MTDERLRATFRERIRTTLRSRTSDGQWFIEGRPGNRIYCKETYSDSLVAKFQFDGDMRFVMEAVAFLYESLAHVEYLEKENETLRDLLRFCALNLAECGNWETPCEWEHHRPGCVEEVDEYGDPDCGCHCQSAEFVCCGGCHGLPCEGCGLHKHDCKLAIALEMLGERVHREKKTDE